MHLKIQGLDANWLREGRQGFAPPGEHCRTAGHPPHIDMGSKWGLRAWKTTEPDLFSILDEDEIFHC